MVDAHDEVPGTVSESVRRSLVHGRPLWRGVMHRTAVPLTIAGGCVLVWTTPPGASRLGAGVFAAGALLMFVASALVHLRSWPIPVWEALFRFDHAAIFILIATSATPVAVSSLEGRSAQLLLWATWIGAAIGVTLRMLPFHPPRGLMNTLFLSLGWVPIVVAPDLFRALDTTVLVLIAVEGILYSGGAIMLGVRWPKLSPRVFGCHEVFFNVAVRPIFNHGLTLKTH